MMRKKVLFLTGSFNQTTQMLRIAGELNDCECWFSQIFSDSRIVNFLVQKTPLLNKTVVAEPFRMKAETCVRTYSERIDYQARLNEYDLVVFCSDMIVPKRLLNTKTIWVQEGMIDKPSFLTPVIRTLKLPRYLTLNTSLNGSGNTCDLYCTASFGYAKHLAKMGTDGRKIYATGIPNYDNAVQYLKNDFPYRDYVMVATSDMRETARIENRPKFIRKCVAIANGRQLLFKLHPNENVQRAVKEIRKYAPADTLIFPEGNTQHMIANCEELITQYSTVVYTGIALGKKVHSLFDVDELYRLAPIQNGGQSAKNIALLCRAFLAHKGDAKDFRFNNEDSIIPFSNTIDFIPSQRQSYAE